MSGTAVRTTRHLASPRRREVRTSPGARLASAAVAGIGRRPRLGRCHPPSSLVGGLPPDPHQRPALPQPLQGLRSRRRPRTTANGSRSRPFVAGRSRCRQVSPVTSTPSSSVSQIERSLAASLGVRRSNMSLRSAAACEGAASRRADRPAPVRIAIWPRRSVADCSRRTRRSARDSPSHARAGSASTATRARGRSSAWPREAHRRARRGSVGGRAASPSPAGAADRRRPRGAGSSGGSRPDRLLLRRETRPALGHDDQLS